MNSKSSDAARRKILKLWTYESPLYSAVNRATQYQDERAIKTLGPYVWVLWYTLYNPPKTNLTAQWKI